GFDHPYHQHHRMDFGRPFGQQQQNPFGDVFKQHTTVDGTAKSIPKDVKKITKSANDE
ncbi:MAG: FxsA family protein, partial [Psychrobacter sp.]|nr:FxsA family protein [Psychrobacter sp.]